MWQDETWFEVAVWWPTRGGKTGEYGGVERCETLAEAKRIAERDRLLGYDHVHIRQVKVSRVEAG